MIEGEIYAGGLTLNFFESAQFEVETPSNPDENAAIIARNAMRVLMMGWNDEWGDLASWQVLKAVFISRDPELLRGMRLAFQQGFNHVFNQLKDRELTPQQFNQAQLFIANCMSLLPFADITPYESFKIPQWINGDWRMVDYKVTPIELTPTKGFRKLFINDDDRVFAYGLEPIVDVDAEPHLIFMGTTYPAGQGFNVQVNTDLEAFETPGKILYRNGRDKIAKWLDKQGKKVHVCGTSLGGSLSLLLAIDQGNKLSRVDALNPPGLYEPWRKSRFDHWDELEEKPQVIVQKQGNDPVSMFGVWKKEWDLLHVIPPEPLQNIGGLIDHALVYAGLSETQFVGVDTEKDNESRKTRNFWLYTLLRSLAYVGHELYRLTVLPAVRYALNHKLLIAAVLVSVALNFLLPVMPTTAFLIMVSVPAAVYLAYKIYQAIETILGWEKVKEPACHNPELPRNESMDIYKNNIEESFSYKELGEYYYAKRCLVGNKPFLPEDIASTEARLSKTEVLKRSLQPEYEKQRINVNASKAKIHDIQQTVKLMNRYRFYQEEQGEVKEALEEQFAAYSLGKH